MRASASLLAVLLSCLLALGCDEESTNTDGGGVDAGTTTDSGTGDVDGGGGGTDAGPGTDSGPTPEDGGPETDAGPGEDGGSADDAGTDTDAGADTDGGPAMDGGVGTDAGPSDGGSVAGDAGTDGGVVSLPDAGPNCHAYDYGMPAVVIETETGTMPTPMGGAIPLGIYDLVRAQNYGTALPAGARTRSTWAVETSNRLQELTASNLSGSGALPTATPRTRRYMTASTMLQSMQTCGGSMTANHGYEVRMMMGRTALRLYVGNFVLTYRQR